MDSETKASFVECIEQMLKAAWARKMEVLRFNLNPIPPQVMMEDLEDFLIEYGQNNKEKLMVWFVLNYKDMLIEVYIRRKE